MKKIILLLVVSTGLLLTSCYKEPENGVATIRVVDENVFRVPNATVTLTGPAGSYIHVSGVTDFNGEWTYEHDPALEVILHIHATSSTGPEFGDAMVRIVPDETAEQTVMIQ